VPFEISTRPLWRVRIRREAARYLLTVLVVAGIVASVRVAIAPPGRSAATASDPSRGASSDRAAEGFATLFARRYLTWTANEPQVRTRALASFAGPALEPTAGLLTPPAGSQSVQWAEVVQQREAAEGEHVYTVAAQTEPTGLLYLTVDVERTPTGTLALYGYPALVGPPSSGPARIPTLHEVADEALTIVVTRALRNYLAGSPSELAADLTPRARVSLPTVPLALLTVQHIDWAPSGSSVVAVVTAQDPRGAQYTLEYELDVTHAQGRWEVSAVQTDQYS
jgi:hypothetical protein